ncbi:hypothetical protein EDD93_5071 [Streptomyces sp. 840.1]|uniref:hypothetical protein n=1 Tax=Streptomyces sp. 840.1 TaxID=2485152 RepID=UPI000F4AA975|nr:hypothetical protein [Streptomyces sp. 840.1]ROQ70547.1 hypothetical protein EDD93_5071 [Streptomyces sp. 840.1]
MTRGRFVAQAPLVLACVLVAWQVWMLFRVTAAESTHVMWNCGGESSCGTDGMVGAAPFMGLAVAAALALMSRRYLHRAAPGAALTLAAVAFGSGWQAAVDAGDLRPDESVEWLVGRFTASDWIAVSWTVAAVFALVAGWGAGSSLRRTGGLHRLRLGARLAVADAELDGWRPAGRGRGHVVVRFEDGDGARHEFPAVVGRYAQGRRTVALYDRRNPGSAADCRVSIPRKGTR